MRIKGACIAVDQLLDAAEEVALRDGVTGLTLEAVAAQAEVSKGGLLYHFHTKERLIAAMVERIVGQWREHLRSAVESAAPGPGRVPRGLLGMCCGGDGAVDGAGQGGCGKGEAAQGAGVGGWDQCVR